MDSYGYPSALAIPGGDVVTVRQVVDRLAALAAADANRADADGTVTVIAAGGIKSITML